MTTFTKLVLLGTTAALAACGVTPSEDIKTSGIWPLMSATTMGDGTTYVSASLFLGNPLKLIFVELSPGDKLLAVQDSASRSMEEFQLFTIVSHDASFPVDAVDSEFQIKFLRDDGDDATDSYASLPPPFDLAPGPTSASRSAAFTLSWTGIAVEPMKWRAEGTCIDLAEGDITDDGMVVIPPNTLKKRPDPMEPDPKTPDTCEVELEIWRTREGSVDRTFDNGYYSGNQKRTMTFTTTP